MSTSSDRPGTQHSGLRGALLAAALCVAAAANFAGPQASARNVAAPATDLTQLIPSHFAGWQQDANAVTQPISAADAAKAGTAYAQTLERVYVDAEQRRIMLSVSYGSQQGDRLQAHRPEFCYQAQGFAIGSTRDAALHTAHGELPLRRLETRRPGRSEPVSYWMTVGEDAALPGVSRKLSQLRQGLSGQAPDGFLVRVSSISDTAREAFPLHDRFITDLLASMPEQERRRLAGRPKT